MKNFLLVTFTLFLFACSPGKPLNSKLPREVFSDPKLEIKHIRSSKTIKLNSKINEGSGLIAWNGLLWTLNDSGKPVLFSLDTLKGNIIKEYEIPGIVNNDWEDLSQDESYIYIGAFGNNVQKKVSSKIYRISKQELLEDNVKVDSITFKWPEIIIKGRKQKDNFDCEAMAVIDQTIYLFTKEWKKNIRTKVFTLPKIPGGYTAKYHTTFKSKILITGASYNMLSKNLVLCGYSLLARPCLFVFSNFEKPDLFGTEGSKLIVKKLPLHQVEGIATFDGSTYYLINEDLRFLFFHTSPQVNKVVLRH